MDRVLKRSDNAPYDYVGKRTAMGKVDALAALLDCSQERINKVRAFAGISGDVFVSEEKVRAMITQRDAPQIAQPSPSNVFGFEPKGSVRPLVTKHQFMEYCRHQIASAETQQELDAALALADVLAKRAPRHRPVAPIVVRLH
jgi:acyl homoserine lactone synthase